MAANRPDPSAPEAICELFEAITGNGPWDPDFALSVERMTENVPEADRIVIGRYLQLATGLSERHADDAQRAAEPGARRPA